MVVKSLFSSSAVGGFLRNWNWREEGDGLSNTRSWKMGNHVGREGSNGITISMYVLYKSIWLCLGSWVTSLKAIMYVFLHLCPIIITLIDPQKFFPLNLKNLRTKFSNKNRI